MQFTQPEQVPPVQDRQPPVQPDVQSLVQPVQLSVQPVQLSVHPVQLSVQRVQQSLQGVTHPDCETEDRIGSSEIIVISPTRMRNCLRVSSAPRTESCRPEA